MKAGDIDRLPPLYLCRHGQTDWNAAGLLQGQSDIPLNEVGRRQAARNGALLRKELGADVSAFAFLSSPMARAAETMRIIRAELSLEPDGFAADDRLVEIHFGDWQGFDLREIGRRDPPGLATRKRDKWNFVPPGDGAESYEDLADRIQPVFEELRGPTVLTAHGGVTRAFFRRFADVPEDEAAQLDIPQDRILRVRDGKVEWI